MESTGEPNRVQMTGNTEQCLQEMGADTFDIQLRGEIDVKGKGKMKTYWVKKNCIRSH